MDISGERVYREMQNEVASLWYLPDYGDGTCSLLIKAPTSCCKALIAGCRWELVFGKCGSYLCVGVRVFDVPGAPVFIAKVQHEKAAHAALFRALKERTLSVLLFGESDVLLAETTATLSGIEAALALLGCESNWYTGPYPHAADPVLDIFCSMRDDGPPPPNQTLSTAAVVIQCDSWRTMEHYVYGAHTYKSINIGDRDEGEVLEKTAWAALTSVFPATLVHSPKILANGKFRELTDVFAFYSHGSLLIEAKALSVFPAGYERAQDRRITGVQKQAKKAVSQLVGAAKVFSRGDAIFDADGKALDINRAAPPHCIALVSELTPAGDWDAIVTQLCDAMAETGAFFHLLDLREFMELLKASSGDAQLLDYNLLRRCELFWKVKSVFIQSEPPENT